MKYLREFVIGSSYFVVVLFYHAVYISIQKKKESDPSYFDTLPEKEVPFLWNKIWPGSYEYFTFFRYTITAPIYFGFWNVLSLIIAELFGLSLRMRFITIGILSSLYMMRFQRVYNIYDFKTESEFRQYNFRIFIRYMLTWNIIVYNLEKYI